MPQGRGVNDDDNSDDDRGDNGQHVWVHAVCWDLWLPPAFSVRHLQLSYTPVTNIFFQMRTQGLRESDSFGFSAVTPSLIPSSFYSTFS